MPIPYKARQRGYARLRKLAERTLEAYRELNSAAVVLLTEGSPPDESLPRAVEILSAVMDDAERPVGRPAMRADGARAHPRTADPRDGSRDGRTEPQNGRGDLRIR